MTDAGDRTPRGPYEKGLTREELLRRAAVGGIALTGVGALGAACGGDDDGTATGTGATETTGEAKRGGTFRVGVPGGGATDLIDGQHIITEPDIARLVATFEGLAYFDDDYKPVVDGLAEEIEAAGNADVWTIRLRSGVEFHNGKTLTADDLVYSIQRMLKPDLGLFGAANFAAVDPNGIEKMDERTVRLTLKRPDSNLLDSFAQYFQGVVPEGYSPDAIGEGDLRWVGTGAFKVESFDPGRQSVHVRNENYWREGQPYFDEVVIIDFPDDRARVNALLGGQVDAIVDLPLAQAPVVEGRSELKVYEAPSGGWLPITMRVDQDPFKDVRVRQAFRLLADREQMVAQALGGHGVTGNDVYSPYDPCYAGDDFPQRAADVEQAQSLLSAAGQDNLTIDLYTTAGAAGMVEAAQVFAQNAKAGGVTVNVKNTPSATFYGEQYLQWVFAMDFWGTRNYLSQVALSALPGATYNETHFDNPQFNTLYEEALATVDEAQRCEIIREMQQIEYDEGGHIVWGFYNIVDAHSNKVAGFKKDGGNLSLNKYGNNFRTIYFV